LKDTFQFADVSQDGYLAFTPLKSQVGRFNVTISASDGFVTVNRTVDIVIKKETKTGPKVDSTWLYIGLVAVILIVLMVVFAVVLSRRSAKKEESHGAAYDNLYAADDKRRQQEMQERQREQRMQQRLEARGETRAAAAPPVVENTTPAPYAKCPKCNSPKIKQMGQGEWMCMKCGKIL
jgi:hypothetical protein